MAFDGNGNYILPSPEFPFIPGTPIEAEAVNNVLADMGAALSRALLKDGGNTPVADINWNGRRILQLGNGESGGDAVNYAQVFINGVFTAPRLQASPAFDAENGLLVPTLEWVRNTAFNAALPGQSPSALGFFLQTDGSVASWRSIDSRGLKTSAKGATGAGAKVVDYREGEAQSFTITGASNFSFSNWPADRTAGILLTLTNAGLFPPAWTGVVWIKSDGVETSNFNDLGITWQVNGRDRVVIVNEPGAVTWGRVVR